ncbi:glycerate kinase [Mycolicibacterium frederiksbergense]|uniref:glycerate kinase n=1 Tax=Mycolicibacterium frederiksbergense TaxID=117567 RepID=UPI00399B714B
MTVLIAPDKFKGSLSASEVADTLAQELAAAGLDVHTLPLADGGDGSVAAALAAGYTAHQVNVQAASGLTHTAAIAVRGDTAVVEIANTCGLGTLPAGVPDALEASSFGFGQAIRQAIEAGAQRIVLALGGSASSDAGIGMLAALGFRFFDRRGAELPAVVRSLAAVHKVSAATVPAELIVAGDVTNPLRGPDGAAAVYGPQKGASAADIDALENGYDNLVVALTRSGWADAAAVAELSGAGAAGGCGFAAALLGARIVSGADFFLDLLDFDRHCEQADLVVTGEGRLDVQTLSGKLPVVVARRAHPKPVVAVVGRDDLGATAAATFAAVLAVTDRAQGDSVRDPAVTRRALSLIAGEIVQRLAAPTDCGRGGHDLAAVPV